MVIMGKHTTRLSTSGTNRFREARRKLETAMQACTDWLATYATSPTSTRSYSREFLLSVMWEQKSFRNAERKSSNVLQLMLVPCSDGATFHSGSKRCWQLWVYSWMSEKQTRQLAQHLRLTMGIGGRGLRLFLVTPQAIVRL